MIKTMQKTILFLSLFFFVLSVPRTYPTEIDGKEFVYHSSILLDEDSTLDQTNVTSSELYDIAVLAVKGAKVRINSNIRISKIVSNSNMINPLEDGVEFQNSDDYKYGLTSAIVAIGMNTEISISNAVIYVDCPFSNAIVAINNAKISMINTTIITRKEYSKGLVAFNYGNMDINTNITIRTEGDFSPCIEVSKDKGDIFAFEIHLSTKGEGSPLLSNLYNGKQQIITADGRAENSPIIIIKGENDISLHYCTFSGKGRGKDFKENDYNNGGIILYRNEEPYNSLAYLQLFHSVLTIDDDIEEIPMFSCYNTEAEIILEQTETSFNQIFMIAHQNDDNNIDTKINLSLNNIGFEGRIVAIGNSQINLKAGNELISNIEIDGNIILESYD